MPKIKNEDIAITTLAKHFEASYSSYRSAYEAFRQLRRKWEESKTGLWIIYVKAYNWDMIESKGAVIFTDKQEINIKGEK